MRQGELSSNAPGPARDMKEALTGVSPLPRQRSLANPFNTSAMRCDDGLLSSICQFHHLASTHSVYRSDVVVDTTHLSLCSFLPAVQGLLPGCLWRVHSAAATARAEPGTAKHQPC